MFKITKKDVLFLIFFLSVSGLGTLFITRDNLVFVAVDQDFHLNRVIALADNIKHGEPFSILNKISLNGFGYLLPSFYNITPIIPLALIYLIFPSKMLILHLFIFFSFLLSFVIAYVMFYWFLKDKNYSFLASVLIALSPYNIQNILNRGSFGEALVNALIPVVFILFLKILFQKQYNLWFYFGFTLGLVFIIHSLSIIFICFSFVVITLSSIFFEKNYKDIKDLAFTYLKSVSIFLVVTGYKILNIAILLRQNNFLFEDYQRFTLEASLDKIVGHFLQALFMIPFGAHIGFLMLISLTFCLLRFKHLNPNEKALLTCFLIIRFVRHVFMDSGLLKETFINTVQFSWRFLPMETIILTLLTISILKNYVKRDKVKKYVYLSIIAFSTASFCFFKYFTYEISLNNTKDLVLVDSYEKSQVYEGIGGGFEYIIPSEPIENNFTQIPFHTWEYQKNLQVLNNKNSSITFKNYNKYRADLSVYISTKKETDVLLPYLYYPYYKVELDGKPLETYPSKIGILKVDVPENTKGHLTVSFKEPLFISVNMLLSLVGTSIYTYLYFKRNRRK